VKIATRQTRSGRFDSGRDVRGQNSNKETSMKFTSFGAAREVTGSNHIIDTGNSRIMIDCGMFQGHRIESERKNELMEYDPASIDALVLTHGHCDHCCRIPLLVKNGFKGNIYATPATRDIASLVMADTAHIQQKDAKWLKKKRPDHPFKPLFDNEDVTRSLDHFVTISYNREFFLPDGVKATFYDAGHILGSAITVLTFPDGTRMGFTGDLGRAGLPIIRDPEPIPDLDYLVCESTYGNRLHDPIDDAMEELAQVVARTHDRGGKIIIPAFAVERTQEVIYFLHRLMNDGRIPKMDIYIDSPMASNATTIFRVHQECYDESVREHFLAEYKNPFGFESLHYTTDVSESKRINEIDKPMIIISSSGMCEAGRILHHLKNNIEDPKNTIIIVGFMAAHTLGRRIAERRPEVRIFGQPYKLKAQVKILNTFSAHADYNEIIEYVSKLDLDKLKRVFLVHGEDDALESLSGKMTDIGVRDIQIVDPKTDYHLSINDR
jgi:metallo-beta-lactamase family protein